MGWGLAKSLLLIVVVFSFSDASAEIALNKRFFDLKAARSGGAVSSQLSLNKGSFMRIGNYKANSAPITTKFTADRIVDRAVQLASLPMANDSIKERIQPGRSEDEPHVPERSSVIGQIQHQWPISENTSQKITSSYGFRKDPFHGHKAFHAGIDIAVPLGTKVLASADGVIDSVGYGKGLGQYVKIQHSDGSYSIYGHLARSVAVKKGRNVSVGDIVGRVGMTGRTTGPHLHFGIKQGDSLVNPVARLNVPTSIRNRYASLLFDKGEKKRVKPLKILDKLASTR